MSMEKRKLKFFCLLIVLLGFFFSSEKVLADNAGLSVDTSLIMLRTEPGKDLQFSFNIKNQTAVEQVVHLEEKDILIGNENELTFVDVTQGPSSWVAFEQNDFVLKPGQLQVVKADIKFPKNEKISNAQMMTMVSFAPEDASVPQGPKVSGNIGVYLILSSSDAQNAAGKVEKLAYLKFVDKTADVSVVYANGGNVQFVPQSKLSIANPFTTERREISFENHFVFPGKKVTFTKNLSGLSVFGFYEIRYSFKDGNGQLLEKTGYVVGKLFPILLLIALLVFGIFIKKLIKIRKENSKT